VSVAILIGLAGLLCFYIEFFIPGGILALVGFLALVGSSVLFCLRVDSALLGFIYVICLLVAAVFVCYLAIKHMKKSGSKNSFFLQKSQEGFSVEKLEEDLTGKEGVVSTELKPAGHVRIDDKVYQAVSLGQFISSGKAIEVIEMKGSHVVVKLKKEKRV
jgi:membrane-bound serine protease (ClpP class)